MAITLYHATYTRSARCAYVLEELGLPYERITFDLANKRDHKTPEFLQIHPLGQVPALVDGDVKMYETLGICLYLADRYGAGKLAPPLDDRRRAAYYQWIAFSAVTLEPVVADFYLHGLLPTEKQDPAFLDSTRAKVDELTAVLVPHVKDRWLLGDVFTTADVLVGYVMAFADDLKLVADPIMLDYVKRFRARPAYQRSC